MLLYKSTAGLPVLDLNAAQCYNLTYYVKPIYPPTGYDSDIHTTLACTLPPPLWALVIHDVYRLFDAAKSQKVTEDVSRLSTNYVTIPDGRPEVTECESNSETSERHVSLIKKHKLITYLGVF